MKPSSAKNKGRLFQQWIRDSLIRVLGIHPEDIESRSMGAGGEDIMLAKSARDLFPYSIEAKNVERINIWEAWKQAKANSKTYEPIVFLKRNRQEPLVLLDAEHFLKLVLETKPIVLEPLTKKR